MKLWIVKAPEDGELINRTQIKELVLCKDCKHRPIQTEPGKEGFTLEFPDYECPCQCDDGWYSWYPNDNWFCANGKRKESLKENMTMKNCKNCKYRYEIEKIKLFPGGVEHVYLDGFACTVRTEENEKVEWLEDIDENEYCCSMFVPKKEQ